MHADAEDSVDKPYKPEQSRLGDEDFSRNLELERAYISGALSAISAKKGDLTEWERARQEILKLRLTRIERELATVRESLQPPIPKRSAETDEPTIIEPLMVESAGSSEENPGSQATILEPLTEESQENETRRGESESLPPLSADDLTGLMELIEKGVQGMKSLRPDDVRMAQGFVALVREEPVERAYALNDLLNMRLSPDKITLGDHFVFQPEEREEYLKLRARLPSPPENV